MRLSQLFGQTLRDTPAEASTRLSAGAQVESHKITPV